MERTFYAYLLHRSFVRWVVHDLLWSRVRNGGLICCLMPGRLLHPFIRSSGDGPISGAQILKFSKSAGDPEEVSVDTPSSSSTVTAGSGSDGDGGSPLRPDRRNSTRWKTLTVQKNYDNHSLVTLSLYYTFVRRAWRDRRETVLLNMTRVLKFQQRVGRLYDYMPIVMWLNMEFKKLATIKIVFLFSQCHTKGS
ncbi:hypothetical protein EVAR_8837_1 [Eumeta japonica]|uniref:Uncharacterized protein n=1 Tax=Eumeta variegata TaxID=151549 RepID=A0A4C1TU16_EUMVA|nr:hypothetical protein EVAR_8837_1 [Eumeta japonica]